MHRERCMSPGGLGSLWLVRESRTPPKPESGTYEDEGSERVSRGSVTLPSGASWFSQLEVPIHGDEPGLLTVRRQAPGPSLAPDETSLVVPHGEAEALLALLQGLFAQARRDGVIPGSEGT